MSSNLPHIIIDGYNFILRMYRINWENESALWHAREDLIRKSIAFRGNKRIKITIVFDGQDIKQIGKIARPSGISVVFSQAPQKADPLILNMIKSAKQSRNITLVTSDKVLQRDARFYGCHVWSVNQLNLKFSHFQETDELQQKYNSSMSQQELEEWLRIFGKEPDE